MNISDILVAGGIVLLFTSLLFYTLRTLVYALSDRPIIEERLRRYAGALDSE